MTAPVEAVSGEQEDAVELVLSRGEAEQLQELLPWVARALEDRPNLTAKQRHRRRATRAAIDGLLAQLAQQLPAPQAPA